MYVNPVLMERRAVVQPAGIAAGRRNKHCFGCPSFSPPLFKWVGDYRRGEAPGNKQSPQKESQHEKQFTHKEQRGHSQ